jgi:catechol-2,3-dioxygenase
VVRVQRLNHAVLYVRDLDRACGFYSEHFGFEVIARERGLMAFLRAEGSDNHHDLGLFAVGPNAQNPPRGSVGLYHLAWQVGSLEDLASARESLLRAGAFVGEADHGATKSIYGHDPDGNEFEIMYLLPRAEWGEYERQAIVAPLHLEQELDSRRT